ncbi:bifunctional 2',3'-cyclic-nucleotide 2'-phosphodiesterase/3'-nucleotidase [Paenibacillus sp. DMB20]|uniref:bifunctional 2',3'-cyclic-nucleotide 2'-phosphodiesterase/3'-nucleotidase n=1 Tax=Paenibacillus sp. DMB20 TaxID=1642570 RepID=UPI000627515B|nr:bifunctional 2',3'-cyclic-nucleotide 2'-phosphodiesterase/3'-nucleotidase [Paenibacillus sp. DMB20]KKO54037.1 2', 3'-cyclic nucleotide 2'-phosphodiesterase [Paenibacillus sp. DMB20]
MGWNSRWNKPFSSLLATALISVQVLGGSLLGTGTVEAAEEAVPAPAKPTIDLRLMSTTDVHTNVTGWDYFKNAQSGVVGLDRTATLVKQAREEQANNLLLDNGDLIQGTPLGTYIAKESGFMASDDLHPMIAAMNLMKYDAATYGNHEFNYGLEFLDRTVHGNTSNKENTDANFPYVNANIYKADNDGNPDNDVNAFTPYVIIDKTVTDSTYQEQTIKVGLIGLVTPQILEWDKAHLEGKVIAKDIAETAAKFVPEMKKKGAQVVIAMAHSGFEAHTIKGQKSENDINELSKVRDIDAITFSHTHKVFPTNGDDSKLDKSFKDPATNKPYNNAVSVVDNVYGQINGTPAVQAGFGGGHLGLIDLKIVPDDNGKWKVDKANSKASTRSAKDVPGDTDVFAAVQAAHDATIAYTGRKLGETKAPMNSYFAMVQDDPTVQVVTEAQKWYVEKIIAAQLPQYKDLPILSVGAPFKAGRNGPAEYTSIAAGDLTIRSASDLYLYDNTLKAIKVKGSVIKEWIEMSAGAFNTIDPASTAPQSLLNTSFQVYNFDVIDGIEYTIDVTKEAKYDETGKLKNASSSRVKEVTYKGQPLNPDMDFIVVTNNYRASGGGNFPGVKESVMVLDSQEENRQVLMDYIAEKKIIDPTADRNWSLAPIAGNVNVTFTSAPEAADVLPNHISYTGEQDAKGFGIFKLNLSGNPSGDVEVHLLGINDFHGQLDTVSTVNNKPAGTAAILATYLKQAKAKHKHSLLFHNGDSVGASAPVSSMERDKPTLEWMNMMGFDVGSLGNHEFDQGVKALMAQLNGGVDPVNDKIIHDKMKFPYVNANAVDAKTGKPIIEPYVIKEVGGVKIGFIGLVTKSTPSKVAPSGIAGVRFLTPQEEVEAVERYAKELQKQGVETIIVLAHDPATTKNDATTGEAADLANALPANSPVDVIVAGDNHALANGEVNGKLIVQAYSYGTAFEDIKLMIDPVTGDVKSKSAEVITTFHEGVTPDADTVALVKHYLDKHPELTKPIGTTDGSITRTDAYNNESALGNLIADAMRSADFGDGKGPADFAFMNPGGIRADLPKGEVTFGDLAKIQPFGNTLVKLTLTGEQIKTLLQQQWNVKPDGKTDTKTLQISGLKYTANMYLPVKERVASLTRTDGTPIKPTQTYTVVVNNFMAAGGDNYKVLTEASSSVPGPIDLDVFYDYIKNTFKGGMIKAGIEGRIVNKLKPAPTPGPTPGPSPDYSSTPTPAPAPTPAPSGKPAQEPVPTSPSKPAVPNVPQTPAPTPVVEFKDLGKAAWAQSSIQSLAAQGIIKGIDRNNFAPTKPITRAEFVALLVRALKLSETAASAGKFTDVKAGAWYADAVSAAVKAGIVKGVGKGKFEPGRKITREEMAVMMANAMIAIGKLQPVSSSEPLQKFADKSQIAPYAKTSVAQLIQQGIISGVQADRFAPKGIANRAQAAVIIYRMLQLAS